ncbi:MAG: hypothetical protein WCC12_05280 [Anaerolineales bacterium]
MKNLVALIIGVACYWIVALLIAKYPFVTILGMSFRSEYVFVPLPLIILIVVYLIGKKKA